MLFLLLQIDPANFEGLKSRLEQKDKEICALKQAAKVRIFYICLFEDQYVHSGPKCAIYIMGKSQLCLSKRLK